MNTSNHQPFGAIAVLAVALIIAACAGFGAFSFNEESEEIVVEASPLATTPLGDVFPTRIPMEIDLEEELAKQDASGAKSVKLRELYFELTENTEKDSFDFIDDITIRVSSRESGSDLPEAELAWRDPVPRDVDKFVFDIDDELDLKPYAEEGLRLRTSASGSAPSSEVRFKVYANFRVDVL